MPKPKNCSCKSHELYSNGKDFKVNRIDSKKYRVAVLEQLKKNGDLYNQSTNLCTACASVADEQLKSWAKKQVQWDDLLPDFIDAIQNSHFSHEQLSTIAFAVGRAIAPEIIQDSNGISQDYKDDTILQNFNVEEYISKRHRVLLQFLIGVSGNDESNNKKNVQLAKTTEHIYYLSNTKFVAPLCFSSNLLTYYMTASKNACVLNSSGSPSGSYSTILNWISDHSREPLDCPVDPDVVTFFDNNQVLGRKWRVKFNFKATTSVLTTVLHMFPDPLTRLQIREDLSPRHWLSFTTADKTTSFHKIKAMDNEHEEVFRKHRNKFITGVIEDVVKEHIADNGEIRETLDDAKVKEEIPAKERYTFVTSNHSTDAVNVTVGDPCFENPCSYESVEKVFEHILSKTVTGSDRHWTILGCDGLPFTLGSRIIENTFTCTGCRREYGEETLYMEHKMKSGHDANVTLNEARKYNNILLLPGLGHYEINMVKAIFKLLWDIGIMDLAKQLGFKSPKALSVCQNATDHHKSWQIIKIFLDAMAHELAIPYCKVALAARKKPTLQGFYEYINGVRDPRYRFLCESIYTFCFALFLFRAGVRRNNTSVINASLHSFSPLFYGLNMPFYMETYLRDKVLRVQCPGEVLQYLNAHSSFSVSGNDTKGEGGDFVLENYNRKVKMWIPPGLPGEQQWLNVYRNIDRLDKVRDNMNEIFGISDADEDCSYSYDLGEEKAKFRNYVRKSGYISHPLDDNKHTTMGGKEVDCQLINFVATSNDNKTAFFDMCRNVTLGTRKKFTPIFIFSTDKEKYNSVANKTKAEIIHMIEEILSSKSEKSLLCQWKKVKTGTKAMLLNFFKELQELTDAEDV